MDLRIIVAQPGVVITDMWTTEADAIDGLIESMPAVQRAQYENLYRRYQKLVRGGGKTAISSDKAAAQIEKGLFAKNPKTRYKFGIDSKLVCFLTWLLPDSWMDWMLARSLNHRPL